MYGENRQLVTLKCTICGVPCPVWVDPEDWERARLGLFVQHAFSNRAGEPYLTESERELFISGSCDDCFKRIRSSVTLVSCNRCGKAVAAPGLCSNCLEVAQLCQSIKEFVDESARLLQIIVNAPLVDIQVMLLDDFARTVIVFGCADGSLAPSELALLADLLCYLGVQDQNATNIASGYVQNFLKENPRPVPEPPRCIKLFDMFDRASGTRHGEVFRSLLFRLSNLVARADGVVTDSEIEFLKYYENLLGSNWADTEPASAEPARQRTPPDSSIQASTARTVPKSELEAASRNTPRPADLVQSRSVESLVAELNGLIGLSQVKAEVSRLASFLQVEQLRKSRGLKPSDISLHMEFYGNPGTGKTTIARLIAQIYRALGFLSRGHLIEADRAKLVGGYLGQTAIKTSEVIEQALGGVLFIDEAYSLARGDSNQDLYGEEAIATILKNMEDHRDDLVVIVAGYPAEMAAFMASNPGLKSRFNRFINFEDYTPEELFQIFHLFANKAQYRISTAAADKLRGIFEDGFKNRDEQFGNGRFVRNLFECSIQQLASRIVSVPHVTDEALTTIETIDIPDAELVSPTPRKVAPIGFEVPK